MQMFSVLIILFIHLNKLIINAEHVHIKLKVPKIIKKHTHVETKYVHIFHPTKVLPQGMVLRSDPTVYPNAALTMDMLHYNPKLYSQMMNTRLFYEKMKQREKAKKFMNHLYSAQATEEHPVVYDFPVDRQLDMRNPTKTDPVSVEDVYFTTSSPEQKPSSKEQIFLPKRHKSDTNIKMLTIFPKRIKKRMSSFPKKYQRKPNIKTPFVIKVH